MWYGLHDLVVGGDSDLQIGRPTATRVFVWSSCTGDGARSLTLLQRLAVCIQRWPYHAMGSESTLFCTIPAS